MAKTLRTKWNYTAFHIAPNTPEHICVHPTEHYTIVDSRNIPMVFVSRHANYEDAKDAMRTIDPDNDCFIGDLV